MSKEIVVITGAGNGLGASLARKFSTLAHYVCLLGRTEATLRKTAETLENESAVYTVDIRSKEHVAKTIKMIQENHGSVTYLVNNAGIGTFKLTEEITEDEVSQMIDTNLKGTIFCTQEVLPIMKENNKGCIINIISGSGKIAKETESVYSASKFGVRGYFEALALELKNYNVHILSAYMGNMKTDLWASDHPEDKMKNYLHPDDVADVVVNNLKSYENLQITDIDIKNYVPLNS